MLVQIDEIHLYRADLRCLRAPTFKSSMDRWLQCKILDAAITWVRHMRPNPDVRADGNIYLERASVSGVLVRDGSVPSYTHALKNKTSTSTYGKKYLSHDMVSHSSLSQLLNGTELIMSKMEVSLPVNMMNKHWYVAVVNAKKRAVQVLDSMPLTINSLRKPTPGTRKHAQRHATPYGSSISAWWPKSQYLEGFQHHHLESSSYQKHIITERQHVMWAFCAKEYGKVYRQQSRWSLHSG